jgi:hypothetical protein
MYQVEMRTIGHRHQVWRWFTQGNITSLPELIMDSKNLSTAKLVTEALSALYKRGEA